MNHTPETWRCVVGYEGRYEVSDRGRVRSWVLRGASRRKRPKLMKITRSPRPYDCAVEVINLSNGSAKGQRVFQVHALVLTAFVGHKPEGMETLHDDGDSTNNRLSNLSWGTSLENHADRIRHSRTNRFLTDAQIEEGKALFDQGWRPRALAERFNCSYHTAWRWLSIR